MDRHAERQHLEEQQRAALEQLGLSPEEVTEAMEPMLSFHLMCVENEAVDALDAAPDVPERATAGVSRAMAVHTPESVKAALLVQCAADTICIEDDDALQLDTPYVLQDGHQLRVRIYQEDEGVTVSDGAFATGQMEMYASSKWIRRRRCKQLACIANELGIEWNVDFYYTEPDMESAIKRLMTLARAVDKALSLDASRYPWA